jgi:hypothetical protein
LVSWETVRALSENSFTLSTPFQKKSLAVTVPRLHCAKSEEIDRRIIGERVILTLYA